jgi:hypothetical protein
MTRLRQIVAALAILATCLTAGTTGAGRAQAQPTGEIVLCLDGAALAVPVDADGRPTGVSHWCPDCVLAPFAGLPAPVAMPAAPAGASAVPSAAERTGAPRAACAPVPPARGPPFV